MNAKLIRAASPRTIPIAAGITAFALALLWTPTRELLWTQAAWFACGLLLAALLIGIRARRHDRLGTAKLRNQLDRTQARFVESSNSQGRFVGNIAHEIKTPLVAMIAQTDLLLRCCDDPAVVHRYATSISEDARHLSDLVESFLRLARPFAQADTSHHVPVFVHDFVLDSVRRSLALAREQGVSVVPMLVDVCNGDAALEVLGDAVLLEAMIENLVRNAVHCSPRGSNVELTEKLSNGSVALHVRDHGTGIAAEHRETVFDWFFRSPGLTLASSGTGFGLAIAQRVAEHHGGSITLRDHPGGGSEFVVTLPRHAGGPGPAHVPTDPGPAVPVTPRAA